ncbi:MAG TPA: polysaccharide biosynthesis/export family protein [Candidatus Didemnitutus sp.]|nr:polysaccharide biosynthesis/export family protein [Candidatus Didemnitutus sp.]
MPLFRLSLVATFVALAALLAGCTSGDVSPVHGNNPKLPAAHISAQLRPGDSLTVALTGIPDPSNNLVQIDEQGLINLPFLGAVTAANLTTNELSQKIRQAYLDRKFYTEISVSVAVTERYIYVGGEVQHPGRIPWSPDLTLSKAIQSAGGFTLYAKEGKVTLTRDRQAYNFDVRLAQRKPSEDPLLFPGDSIQIPRSAF